MGGKKSVNEIGWEKEEKKRAGRWENCEREAECEKEQKKRAGARGTVGRKESVKKGRVGQGREEESREMEDYGREEEC